MQCPCAAIYRDQPQSEAQRQHAAIEEALRGSRVAESALQHSHRVGDMLLKNEDEEVQRVTEYAEELLDHEYRWVIDQSFTFMVITSHTSPPQAVLRHKCATPDHTAICFECTQTRTGYRWVLQPQPRVICCTFKSLPKRACARQLQGQWTLNFVHAMAAGHL